MLSEEIYVEMILKLLSAIFSGVMYSQRQIKLSPQDYYACRIFNFEDWHVSKICEMLFKMFSDVMSSEKLVWQIATGLSPKTFFLPPKKSWYT